MPLRVEPAPLSAVSGVRLALLVRMTVGGRGVFVGGVAMLLSRGRVLLGFVVFAKSVVMLGLMMMMRSRVVVSSRQMMMLGSPMLRCLCHFVLLPGRWFVVSPVANG